MNAVETAVLQKSLFTFAPHWRAAVEGPLVPALGGVTRMTAQFTLLAATEEEAVAEIHRKIEEQCAILRMPYVADDWRVMQLVIVNGN